MSSVRVKTLTGSSIDILVDPSTKVVDLKKSLRDSGNAILAKCKLFFSGAILRDDILLNSLDIPAGGFLVAIPMSLEGKQTRQVKALRQKESTVSKSSSIDLEGPSPTSPTGGQACPGSRLLNSPIKDTRLDTLLPGYSIRPSPVKPGRGSGSSRPAALRENREDHEFTVGLPHPNHCTKKPGLSFLDQAPIAADLLQPKLVVQDIVSEPGVVTPDDMSQEGQKGMCESLVLDQPGGDPFDAMLQKDGENRVTEIVDLSASPIKPGKLVRKWGSKAKTTAVVVDVQGGSVQNEEGMDRRRKRGNPRKVQEVSQDDSLEAGATSTKKVRKCKKKTSPVPLKRPGMVETASAADPMIQGHGNDLKTDPLVPISECYTGRPSPKLQEDLNLVESLPLPPPLLRLRQALGALTEVHAFLIKRHVLPTWHALSSILKTASQQHIEKDCSTSGSAIKDVVQSNGVEVVCSEAGLKLQDVLHLSALLPSVVVLRDRTRPHEDVVKPLLSLSDYPFLEAFDRKSTLGSREDKSVEASRQYRIAPFSTELLHTNSTGAEVSNVEGMTDAGKAVLAAAEQCQSHDTPVVPSRTLEQPGAYNCPSSLVVDLIDPGKPVWERHQFETSLANCDPLVMALLLKCGAAGSGKVERCQAVFTRHVLATLLHLQQQSLLQRGGAADSCALSIKNGTWSSIFSPEDVSTEQVIDTLRVLQEEVQKLRNSSEQAPMKGCSSTDDYTQLGSSTAATKQVHTDAAKQGDTSGPVLNGAPRPPCMLKDTAPCTSTQAMTPGELLSHLKEVGWYKDQVIKEHSLPGRPASHAQLRSTLGPAVLRALQSKGVTRMFSHQVQAIDSIIEGKQHTVIATSTASGKSLCFHVPILAALESDPRSTALLMFPTKALAQDQRTSLKIMLAAAFGPDAEALAETYDGDTSMSSRDEVRVRCQLLVTNPDMLHLSILPVHAQFSALLSNLKYVVMDEGHSYYGAFGAHTCHVIRRLRRICRQYGSDPVFIVASATIANPQQHAQMLIGVPYVHLVDQDTSPHGPQTFVFWNPPLLNESVPSKGSAVPGCAVESLMMGSVQHTRNPPHHRRGRKYERKASTESTKGSIKAVPRRGKRGRLDDDKDIPTVPSLTVKEKVSANPVAEKVSANPVAEKVSVNPVAEKVSVNPVAEAAQLQPSQDRAALAHHDMKVQAANAHKVISEARGHASPGLSGGGKSWLQESPSSSAVVVIGALGSKKITDPSIASIAGSTARDPNKESRFQRLRREALQRFPSFHDWKQAQIEMGRDQKLDELRRSSPIVEISLLLSECIKHGLRTIAFCKSRKLCELVATYTRETLKATTPHLANSFKVYRGGYSPAERRGIEADLFSGRLLAVAATNALELGVDVGSLDVTLHLGFQGTIASMRQQAGRAGRREQPSMAIYVAFDGPLDQHFMRQPEDLFERKIENAQLDSSNEAILHQHLACAASELPLNIDAEAFDAQLYGIQLLASAVNALQNQGLLSRHPHSSSHLSANIFYYSGSDSSFARKVALRTIDVDQYEVVEEGSGQVLEKIEGSKAFYHIYDGAVYLHQGRTFLCRKLDLGLKVALVRPADLKYYTRVRDYKDVHVTGDKIAYPAGEASLHFPKTAAECESAIVTARFYGFNRMWQGSGQVFDSVELHLPDVMFETQAAFIRVPPSARAECMEKGLDFKEGLHAAGHAMLNVLPLYLLCNTKDIAAECQYPYSTRFRVDRLLLYDRQGAGGVGLSAQAAPMFHLLLVRAFETIAGCACEAGCPSCIHHAECPSYNTVLNKASGLVILRHVLEIEAQLELRSTPNSANNVNITASCKHCTSCI